MQRSPEICKQVLYDSQFKFCVQCGPTRQGDGNRCYWGIRRSWLYPWTAGRSGAQCTLLHAQEKGAAYDIIRRLFLFPEGHGVHSW